MSAATPQLCRGYSVDESRRRRGDGADIPWMSCGDAATTPRAFSRRRVAATPRRRRRYSVDESRRRRGDAVDIPWRRGSRRRCGFRGGKSRRRRGCAVSFFTETSRGDAAAAPWFVLRRQVAATPRPRRGFFRGDESWRRRGAVDIPWRQVAGDAAAATWIFRGDESPRPRRGYSVRLKGSIPSRTTKPR